MAKGNGSTRSAFTSTNKQKVIAVNTNGVRLTQGQAAAIKGKATRISDMKNRDMQKEIQQAISRYEAVMGVRERNIKLADLNGAYGVTYINGDGSQGIYLNRKSFDVPKKEFEQKYASSNYARRNGFKNMTRKPAQHTVTHELAHATWTSNYTSDKAKAAGKEIRELYRTFVKDKSSSRMKGYGSYGKSDVDEFWAEVITKGIHGDNDRYTRKAFAIAKRYNL